MSVLRRNLFLPGRLVLASLRSELLAGHADRCRLDTKLGGNVNGPQGPINSTPDVLPWRLRTSALFPSLVGTHVLHASFLGGSGDAGLGPVDCGEVLVSFFLCHGVGGLGDSFLRDAR